MTMYVVAGVTGHVGSVVANELLARGKKVKVIVRDEKRSAEWSGRGAEVARGSLEDRAFLTAALRGATGFFTLLPPNTGVAEYHAGQRRIADAIAGAVKDSGVPHVAMLSSVGAELSEKNGPIKNLNYLENALKATGTKLTAIRAGYFQENVAGAIMSARQAGIYPNMLPSADYAFPMVATRDIGRLGAQALESPPAKSEAVDLHGPAYSHRQVAEKIGNALSKPLQIVDVPPQGQVAAFKQFGFSQEVAEAFVEMNAGFASGIIKPSGDRFVAGTTTIDETLATLLTV